jgi:peptide/nickel transport system substrate-binding protein
VAAFVRTRHPANRPPAAWLCAFACILGLGAAADAAEARHAIAMHGEPALADGFAAFRYVNPAAPKGGRLTEGVIGTFDSLNPYVVRGLAEQRVRGYVIESLMARGYDEPFTLYGLLAQSVETDADRTYVIFRLNPAAHFSDGRPVTAEDVVFSWEILRDKGRPNHRTYYAKVTKAEIVGPGAVRFDLSAAQDRELPLILGLMPVLPKHAVDPDTFEDTTLTPLVGSGPYVIAEVRPGHSVRLSRDPGYWGRDLAVNRGFWNFDEIRIDYYRDGNSHFEAFKKGLFDLNVERDPSRWETAYDIPAVRDGRIVKDTFSDGMPKGLAAFVFNTRKAPFGDIRVREALTQLLDAEWINHNFFFDRYRRTASYFEDSELSARGRPADERERALLAPFAQAVRADILDGTWSPPASDGSGRDREALKRALALLAEAGYALDGTVLRERGSGKPLAFEILVTTRDQERLALAFQRNLKRAGIDARVRVVDAVQYDRRQQTYDFDMIQYRWDQSLSPGNEQAFYWGAAAADVPGTRNYMGVKSAAVDAMVAAMLAARTRVDFVAAVRALDRVLMSGFYVIPLFYLPQQWVARQERIAHPADTALYGYLPETWWRQPQTQ